MGQSLLPFQDEATLAERFERWLADLNGQAVYREFVTIAKQLRAAGQEHYGAKSIMETIRYHRAVRGPATEPFRINNVYTSRIARLAMEQHPELSGMFETRELKS